MSDDSGGPENKPDRPMKPKGKRSALQFLKPNEPDIENGIEEDALGVDDTWRKIVVSAARTTVREAAKHEAARRQFLRWGWIVATLGMIVFISLIGMYEWAAAW